MKRMIILAAVFLFCALNVNAIAGGKKKRPRKFTLSASMGVFYDNNILHYSDYYLNEFLSGENNGRFHISTYDDLVLEPKIKIAYRTKIIPRKFTEVYIQTRFDKFFVNSIKDWAQFIFGIKQNLFFAASINFEYNYIPRYYIRHYRDKEWTEFYGDTYDAFKKYSFVKENFSFALSKKISGRFSARFYYDFARYYYSEYFTEYDAKQNVAGGRLYYAQNKIKANIGVKFLSSRAKGKIGVDPSYKEYKYYFGFGYSLPEYFGMKNGISVFVLYNERFYTGNFSPETDPIHSGRFDKYYSVYFNYKVKSKTAGDITFFLNWAGRLSETVYEETSELLSRDKNFNQFRFGVKYKYSIKF